MSLLTEAIARFDAYNQQDPNSFEWEGRAYAREYFFALKRSEWLLKVEPKASEALKLAARCQHLGRWESPRTDYAPGRIGYLKWRKELAQYHADKASQILHEVGYDEATIASVREIVLKKGIKTNPDVQAMENALCLVFLAYQYESFCREYPDKIVDILVKSLLKMDATGHAIALEMTFSEQAQAYLVQALQALKNMA